MESRFCNFLCHATGDRMSKSNYDLVIMIAECDDYQQEHFDKYHEQEIISLKEQLEEAKKTIVDKDSKIYSLERTERMLNSQREMLSSDVKIVEKKLSDLQEKYDQKCDNYDILKENYKELREQKQ